MDFRNVDAGDPRALIEYLDAATRTSADDKQKTFAAQRLAPGMRVLDAGCGTGDDVRTIASIVGESGRAEGVDLSRAMIDEAIARGVPPNAGFAVAPAAALPFDDASFDAVRAERLLQHLEDPDAAAREMRRVLRPGGTALLLDQDWGSLVVAGAERSLTERVLHAYADRLANPWAGRNARGLLRRAGFTDVAFLPMVAASPLPRAFETTLKPAIDSAMQAGAVDAPEAHAWLAALLEAEARGEFLCAVIVVVALGRVVEAS